MKTTEFSGRLAVLFPAFVAAIVGTGCISGGISDAHRFTYASVEEFTSQKDPDTGSRFYYVQSVDGFITVPEFGNGSSGKRGKVTPGADVIMDALSRRFPNTFARKDGAVPLHVRYFGNIAPINMAERALCAVPQVDGQSCVGGKISVSILVDDAGDRRVAHVPYRRFSSGIPTLPSLVRKALSAKDENQTKWSEIRLGSEFKGVRYLDGVFSELIASGIAKSLGAMTEEQRGKLLARVHKTVEQRRAMEWLTGSSAATFSVAEGGGLFVEAEHKFTPVKVDFAELSKFPEILKQSFDSSTRTGTVVADISGCDENVAIDYLLGRLVPEICRTKSVVFDPVKTPPVGAQYKIGSYTRETIDEKDIVRIGFTALM
ncbi:MAG: hypothetical protein IJ783_04235 [Kiritimatiellae bacterium]|nr:hypothetical protein [Kiritimatiellia bacterium]